MGRPPAPLLSRRAIARTALEEGLVNGPDSVTMRNVGRRMGVHVSSLYNHVDNLKDLHEAMRDLIWDEIDLSAFDESPWDVALGRWAESFFGALFRHRPLVPLLSEPPVTSSTLLSAYDRVAQALLDGGLPADRALQISASIESFIVGSVIETVDQTDQWSTAHDLDKYPALRRLNAETDPDGRTTAVRSFRYGLQLMLAGIRAEFPDLVGAAPR